MNVLVTGAKGFVGKNLVAELSAIADGRKKDHPLSGKLTIYQYDIDTPQEKLLDFTKDCEFVFHLAGVNRPEKEEDFLKGNFGFTSTLLDALKSHKNTCPVMISSSIQAALDNPYGKSKKAGEDLIYTYSQESGASVYIYRFPNLFGKWCRPNYNSVVATFCYNIANDLPIKVNDAEAILHLSYIDDVVEELIHALMGNAYCEGKYCSIPTVHTVKLGEIVKLLHDFKVSRNERAIPDMSNAFTQKLYSTYLSYLPTDDFAYPLKMNADERGSFTEFIRTPDRGQVSVNISKPGITKGNHWHHTKNEKFLVVSGRGVIRFRKPDSKEIISYSVCGDKLEVVDIPVGYTHNIENTGDSDMITIMWCNECFDPEHPDTYFLEV